MSDDELVTVYALNGVDARRATRANALRTLADMTGLHATNLRVDRGWVSFWSFQDGGTIVGRIA